MSTQAHGTKLAVVDDSAPRPGVVARETVSPEVRSLDDWAEVIRGDLARAVEGMIAAGRHLNEARTAHSGVFRSWLDSGAIGISRMTAYRLMRVAEALGSLNTSQLGTLPPDRTALYDLSRMHPEDLRAAMESGEVHAGTSRADAHRIMEMTNRRRNPPKPATSAPRDPVEAPAALLRVEAHYPNDDFDDPVVRAECFRIAASPDDHFERAIEAAKTDGDLSRQNVIRHLDLIECGGIDVERNTNAGPPPPRGSVVEKTVAEDPCTFGFVGFELHFTKHVMSILQAAVWDCLLAGIEPEAIIEHVQRVANEGLSERWHQDIQEAREDLRRRTEELRSAVEAS